MMQAYLLYHSAPLRDKYQYGNLLLVKKTFFFFSWTIKFVLVWECSSVWKDLWRESICLGRDGSDIKLGGPYPMPDTGYQPLTKSILFFKKLQNV